MPDLTIDLDRSGRLVIPHAIRKQLNLEPETQMILTVEGNEIRLKSVAAARKAAQDLVRRYVPEADSLVDDLLEERRRDRESESGGD